MPLSSSQYSVISTFLQEQDMPNLYRSYTWEGDTWKKGFPDLFRLEREISAAAKRYAINRDHLLQVAEWGKLPNKKGISCRSSLKVTLYVDDTPACWLSREPENAVCILESQIRGFGPTYCSKILHFAVPQVFGALDTRLVRTFGRGDDRTLHRYQLLDLSVSLSGNRWTIPSSQEGWPREYGTWVAILNHIAQTLNRDGIACPHPPCYTESGLREEGMWLPADVETALFSYASQQVEGYEKKRVAGTY